MSESADRQLVMITGATRELGREVCHLFAGDDWDLIMVADDDLDRTAESLRSCGVHVRALPSRLESAAAAGSLWQQAHDVERLPDAVVLINRAYGWAVHGPGEAAGLMMAVEAELAPTVQLARLAMSGMIIRGSGEIMIITEPTDGPDTDGAVARACASMLTSMVQGWQQELHGTRVGVRTLTADGTSGDAARSSFDTLFGEPADEGLLPRFRALTRATRDRLTAS